MSYVPTERIEWDDEAAAHIRTRSARYPGDTDIDSDWTAKAVSDPQRLVDEPDPKSRHQCPDHWLLADRADGDNRRGATRCPGDPARRQCVEDTRRRAASVPDPAARIGPGRSGR